MAEENLKLQRPGDISTGEPLGPLIDMVGMVLENEAFVAASARGETPESETIALM